MDGLVSLRFFMPSSTNVLTRYRLGSFHEYLPAVEGLTQRGTNKQGLNGEVIWIVEAMEVLMTLLVTVSFEVVIPSLPGFTFSSLPSVGWKTNDTARIFNTLMEDVLGFPTYSVYGGDWVWHTDIHGLNMEC
jgi:hypothetical protein